ILLFLTIILVKLSSTYYLQGSSDQDLVPHDQIQQNDLSIVNDSSKLSKSDLLTDYSSDSDERQKRQTKKQKKQKQFCKGRGKRKLRQQRPRKLRKMQQSRGSQRRRRQQTEDDSDGIIKEIIFRINIRISFFKLQNYYTSCLVEVLRARVRVYTDIAFEDNINNVFKIFKKIIMFWLNLKFYVKKANFINEDLVIKQKVFIMKNLLICDFKMHYLKSILLFIIAIYVKHSFSYSALNLNNQNLVASNQLQQNDLTILNDNKNVIERQKRQAGRQGKVSRGRTQRGGRQQRQKSKNQRTPNQRIKAQRKRGKQQREKQRQQHKKNKMLQKQRMERQKKIREERERQRGLRTTTPQGNNANSGANDDDYYDDDDYYY
uniref:BZIP domain-containing protein n=2 Tax=Strongyloides stercoralis TaxID=6248 RepID=A0AAF5DQR7_STRER